MRPRQVRLERLRQLVAEAGSIAELARRSGTNEKYLGQILKGVIQARGRAPRSVGDDLAQRLELGMGKQAGWLDLPLHETLVAEPRATYQTPPSLSDDEVALVLCWRKLFDHQRAEFLPLMVKGARNAVDVEHELERRRWNSYVPDDDVAKHLPARPPQRELPIAPAATAPKTGKKGK